MGTLCCEPDTQNHSFYNGIKTLEGPRKLVGAAYHICVDMPRLRRPSSEQNRSVSKPMRFKINAETGKRENGNTATTTTA